MVGGGVSSRVSNVFLESLILRLQGGKVSKVYHSLSFLKYKENHIRTYERNCWKPNSKKKSLKTEKTKDITSMGTMVRMNGTIRNHENQQIMQQHL